MDPLNLYYALTYSSHISGKCDFILNSLSKPTPFYLGSYLMVYGLTCLIEMPIYFLVLRDRSIWERTRILILANLATHPVIYFLFPLVLSYLQINVQGCLLISEAFAPLTEGLLLWRIWGVPPKSAFFAMLLANMLSWIVGSFLI
jgi:hypothetical protein